jgi:hypothetical protein
MTQGAGFVPRPASCPETYTEVDEQTIGGHEDDGRNCRKTCLRCP